MNINVIQPHYSMNIEDSTDCLNTLLHLLDECGEDSDIIVLPEYSDVLTACSNKAIFDNEIAKNHNIIMQKAIQTARRCKATLFINAVSEGIKGYRNTTYAINSNGEIVGKYYKSHPAPSEVKKADFNGEELDVEYSYHYSEPYVLEIDSIRYGFMTCYDFYFYEAYAALARKKVDIIIGCALQRTDTHHALKLIGEFLSYQTNAYLVRSSVSLGSESLVCGSSMVVAPDGTVLLDMGNTVGIGKCSIDPKQKYYKAAGFGGKIKSHSEYMEEGRRPWNYRPAGPAIIPGENILPYPRVCAHRGFNTIAPENTLPAFGAAIALGAEEIEFDLWPTTDNEIVSCHDDTLDRVSTGTGKIYEHDYDSLKAYDFGIKYSERFKGLSIVTFEQILQKFGCHVIMNVHIKPIDKTKLYPTKSMEKIVSLVRKYDCEKHVYFMLETDEQIKQFKEYAPDIPVCVGWLPERPWAIVDRAISLGAQKVQLFKPYYNQEMINLAHKHGILCNFFWSDNEEETLQLLNMGVDTILSNDYFRIAQTVQQWNSNKKEAEQS